MFAYSLPLYSSAFDDSNGFLVSTSFALTQLHYIDKNNDHCHYFPYTHPSSGKKKEKKNNSNNYTSPIHFRSKTICFPYKLLKCVSLTITVIQACGFDFMLLCCDLLTALLLLSLLLLFWCVCFVFCFKLETKMKFQVIATLM